MQSKPPTKVSLRWTENLAFVVRARDHAIVTDGDSTMGISPVELLAASLAACMGTDVAHILARGRQGLTGLDVQLEADRAQENPHRFVRVRIHFAVTGEVNQAQLERAIALSHEKYCSVWHSLRQDIALELTSSLAPT